jgi:hypothetical protein
MPSLRILLGGDEEDFPQTAPIINEIKQQVKADEVELVEIVWAEDKVVVHLKSGRMITAHAMNMTFTFENIEF